VHQKFSKIPRIQNMCFAFLQHKQLLRYKLICDFAVKKVAKHIWDQCCHLVVDTGSWFILIC